MILGYKYFPLSTPFWLATFWGKNQLVALWGLLCVWLFVLLFLPPEFSVTFAILIMICLDLGLLGFMLFETLYDYTFLTPFPHILFTCFISSCLSLYWLLLLQLPFFFISWNKVYFMEYIFDRHTPGPHRGSTLSFWGPYNTNIGILSVALEVP